MTDTPKLQILRSDRRAILSNLDAIATGQAEIVDEMPAAAAAAARKEPPPGFIPARGGIGWVKP